MHPSLPTNGLFWIYPRHYFVNTSYTLLRFFHQSRQQKKPVRDPRQAFILPVKLIYFSIRSFFSVFITWFYSLISHLVLGDRWKKAKSQKVDAVIQAFMVEKGFGPSGNDFYYGDLDKKTKARGLSSLFFYVNFSPAHFFQYLKFLKQSSDTRIPEWMVYHVLDPVKIYIEQWKSFFKLAGLYFKAEDMFLKETLKYACVHVMSHQTAKNMLFYFLGYNTIHQFKPKAFIHTYEGQAWEACGRAGAKAASTQCKTMGYQHTFLFKESYSVYSMFSTLPNGRAPETVFALGEIPIDLMRRNEIPENVEYISFGSFRFRPGSVGSPPKIWTDHCVLVTPEGLADEMIILFSFAVRCAKAFPNVKFIFRCHPLFPFQRIKKFLPSDILDLSNIEISDKKDMKDDFDRCDILLNRRSSTALYAILNGLKLVFLPKEGAVDSDPLFALESWRWECKTPKQFKVALDDIDKLSPEEQTKQWEMAASYVRRYTGPVTEENIDQFVKEIRG